MATALLALAVAGCRQDMHDSPYNRPLTKNALFPDGTSSRPIVEGTVARGLLHTNTAYYSGRMRPTGTGVVQPRQATATEPFAEMYAPDLVNDIPVPVTRDLVLRGKQRYEMYCSPCHAYTGEGNGMIVQRGLTPPPSLHIDRLKQAPAGHFFDVITNGYGAMYSYAARVQVSDRWAIVAYIRALQRAFEAKIDDVPPEERDKLSAMPQDPDVRLVDTRTPDAAAAAKQQPSGSPRQQPVQPKAPGGPPR